MKSKNLASRQDLLQTDEDLPDKGPLGQVLKNLDSDLVSTVTSLWVLGPTLSLGFPIFMLCEVSTSRTRALAKECALTSSSPSPGSEAPSSRRSSRSGLACSYSYSHLLGMTEVIFCPWKDGGDLWIGLEEQHEV